MRFQKMGLTKAIWRKPRMQIAELVAASYGKGWWVALRIIDHEEAWIESRAIKSQRYVSMQASYLD